MKKISLKIGKNLVEQYIDDYKESYIDYDETIQSWKSSVTYSMHDNANEGLRSAQLGAIFAIRSYWTVQFEPATIIMPTGTGKTETIITTLIAEQCNKTLIVVPSKLLHKQTVEKCLVMGILKKIKAISAEAVNPIVGSLLTTPKTLEELTEILEKSHIIVTTMSLLQQFSERYISQINSLCTHLIIDEAHHIPAKTWNEIKYSLLSLHCLQFTATPFRNDGKRIDGNIIYNFPLSKAQEQEYFQPIDFYPIYEYDGTKADYAIAQKAVEVLEQDIKADLRHVLLVRTNTKEKAKELFDNIYMRYFDRYNPVIITSDTKKSDVKERTEQIQNCYSRILVCVNMFSEGIDIPNLKIAAIHDKYKSLPITLQFIGRFTRTQTGLENAKIIANIADDDINESVSALYEQDADWNQLINVMSKSMIDKEVSLQELARGFKGDGIDGISITQLIPKVSMVPFSTEDESWYWQRWTEVFPQEKCRFYVNDDVKILAVLEMEDSSVQWTSCKNIHNINWQLHLIYWNKSKKMFFINSSSKNYTNKLAEKIFKKSKRITGENIFRCLHGINRLMLGTVGLRTALNGPIRYKMFAGIDISEGITEAQKENCIKSNLFGVGYDGKSKVSIGCSYKGTIWSRWIESIDFWRRWCDQISDKLSNEEIDITTILEGALIPKVIEEVPNVFAYLIEWPNEIDVCTDKVIRVSNDYGSVPIYETEIRLLETTNDQLIEFCVTAEGMYEVYQLIIDKDGYQIKRIKSDRLVIAIGNSEQTLCDYLQDNPPIIKFVDQSMLEGNLLVTIKQSNFNFDLDKLMSWDWKGTDIKAESQGLDKVENSIQYKVIEFLKKKNTYEVIFDDDNAGEIADIVAIKEENKKIVFEFYHCKFSHGDKPGARILDLYEVCGQAEKSVKWRQDPRNIISRMKQREGRRINKNKTSRFEIGSLEKLMELNSKLKVFEAEVHVFIVQPGVDKSKITKDMERLLCGTSSYLMDTYSMPLKLICS